MKNDGSLYYVNGFAARHFGEDNRATMTSTHQYTTYNGKTGEYKLNIVQNPVRPIWITKPKFRNHKDRKLAVHEAEVDMVKCPDHLMYRTVWERLGNPPNPYVKKKDAMKEPYSYGTDVTVDTLVKHEHNTAYKYEKPEITYGVLDLETNVAEDGNGEIILASYVAPDRIIYLGVLEGFMPEGTTAHDIGREFRTTEAEYVNMLNDKGRELYDSKKFGLKVFIHRSEETIIRWTMTQIHLTKPMFCGIWNLNFDIPRILKRLDAMDIDIPSVMCHPDVPPRFRVCEYKEDTNKKIDHFSKKWHWLTCSGYTQFIDAMCLYSRIRISAGRESSYKLEDILAKYLGTGKIKFKAEGGHSIMQRFHFIAYAVYCCYDSIGPALLETLNGDVPRMMSLVGVTNISSFSKQTRMTLDKFYFTCRESNTVPGASPPFGSIVEWAELIENTGGAVLDPKLAHDTGHRALYQTSRSTSCHKYVSDIDAKAMYPTLMATFNVCKTSKLSTVVQIEGIDQDDYDSLFTAASSPLDNAVELGSDYFNLPGYGEMITILKEKKLMTS